MKPFFKWLIVLTVIVCVVIAFVLGWWIASTRTTMIHSAQQGSSAMKQMSTASKQPLYWVAPMNPNYRRDKPGKSPMGMDLVPVYGISGQAGTIKISPQVENNLGVRTAVVKKIVFPHNIRTVGYVQPDESTLQTVSVYTQGWIRQLNITAAGEPVKKHQLLFKVYSPVLISAQEEYLLALKHQNQWLVRAGKQKLLTLGMSAQDIGKLGHSKQVEQNVPVYARESGYVTKLNIREGMHVMPAMSLLSIANLSKIWVIAEVYEQQAALIKVGQFVKAKFIGMPGKELQGRVNYIYPELNAKTRTTRVRLVFANPNEQLKPGMYANIIIDAGKGHSVIAIPKEALIPLGDSDRVILSLGNGQFKPIIVKVGQQNQNWAAITEGLKPGDKVVTSAQFLLDSESSMKAGLSRLTSDDNNQQAEKPPTTHDHARHAKT